MSLFKKTSNHITETIKPDRKIAEEAIRTLIAWAGDNPQRDGVLDTPKRVLKAFDEFFSGYHDDPEAILAKAAEDAEDYNEIIILKNMRFVSHCQHHMAPIIGKAHIAYVPHKKIVGISKLARILDAFSKRLQKQEALTIQIAQAIENVLSPQGVAVIIDAAHECMTTRGVHKHETTTITTKMTGIFKKDAAKRSEFMALIASGK